MASKDDTPPSGAPSDAIFNERQLRMLKIAVIVMALILLVGFAVVIGRVIHLINRPAAGTAALGAPSGRVDIDLALPPSATIKTVTASGNRLIVHYESPTGSGMAVLDLASGTVLQRVRLVPEAPQK